MIAPTRPPLRSAPGLALLATSFLMTACDQVEDPAGESPLPDDPAPEGVWPIPTWDTADPEEVGMERSLLVQAREYALTAGGSGIVVRQGKAVMRWGDQKELYDLKSSTKSIGVSALGLALADGLVALDDPAEEHHGSFGTPPSENQGTGWLDAVTVEHLATQTAGFDKPGGYELLLFEPGTMWHYSDGGPNWLAEAITLAYGRDLRDLLFERVFDPIGIAPEDLTWRDNRYRPHEIEGIPRRELGAGIHANVDAMARIGYLYLRDGAWRDAQLLPADFVARVRTTPSWLAALPEHPADPHPDASNHYGLLWWTNVDGTLEGVPQDAFWSWGLFDSVILVVPSLDLVVARAGPLQRQWGGSGRPEGSAHYEAVRPFFELVVSSIQGSTAPYPQSAVVEEVEWAPREEILRLAEGSDNWPLAWADDGHLYGAYGDGWGFQPRVPEKLSLGLVRIEGSPPDVSGYNLRSPSAEQTGDGATGRKASGMLMVDGVLYMLVRNADNAQLAWSEDRGLTWTWVDWRFETSFGAPTFLTFGEDYAGARDEYVYVYSADAETAYEPSDRLVLARVPKDRITDRDAYAFFAGRDAEDQPLWSADIEARAAIFDHPGAVFRVGVTHHPALGRYLLCHSLPGDDPKFQGGLDIRYRGGFGIFDAPEPWGPWSTVFFTPWWDVGPGETCSLPAKWTSADGRTAHLVFSGDDHFSVRRVRFGTAGSGAGTTPPDPP